jgi:hypothetical protein
VAENSSSTDLKTVGSRKRNPHWYGVPVRVLLLTLIGTLLTFCVALLFSILGTIITDKLRGVPPDMRVAYHIAVPIAMGVGLAILLIAAVNEIRQYRQSKALTAIERMS